MQFELSPLYISLKTALVATLITFFLGVWLARWMVFSNGIGKIWVDGIIILPMVLPPTVIGFILLVMFSKNSVIGQALHQLGMTVVFSWSATVIAAIVVSLPLMYKTSKGAFEQIDRNIIDAARTLGVSEFIIFWKVIIPLSLPGILAGVALSFARALGEFGATLMLAGNIPGKTQTIPLAVFFAVESGDMATAYRWVAIVMLISFAALLAMNYWNWKHYRFNQDSRGRS